MLMLLCVQTLQTYNNEFSFILFFKNSNANKQKICELAKKEKKIN
jgi:hypothetical protein